MKGRKKSQNAISILNEQRRLLQLEYNEEKKAYRLVREKVGLRRMLSRGDAVFPLLFHRSFYNSLNQKVVEVLIPCKEEESETEHNFEYGKPVMFFTMAGETSFRMLYNGIVSYVDGNRLVISVADSADTSMLQGCEFGLALSFDETTYRLMFEAIERTISADGRLGQLRDLIYSGRQPGQLYIRPMGFPYLNQSQENGVNKILRAKDFAILHGPPGTGKTTTLVEAIYETLHRESQVLVCAQSNAAVDWISEKLTDRGVKVLRLGNPCHVNDKMLSFTYERRFADHPDYPTLWSIRKAIRELYGIRRHNTEQWHSKMDRLKSRETELEIRINNDIFGDVNVIASTLTGSASKLLDGMKFSTLFIDEAAQALEAACWIAIRRAGRIILAGDHCQLPPTVKCYDALKQGLGVSLMERIVQNHPDAVTLLRTQYRMHDDIMQFSNKWFYNGAMDSASQVRNRGILDLDIPIEVLDTSSIISDDNADAPGLSFQEENTSDGCGKLNRDEALVTVMALRNYIGRIGKQRFLEDNIDVGIISPYRAQVRYLRQLIKRIPDFRPFRKNISVNTVDGFQGQERDVMLISMVRSNENGNIGFLRDLRRMNVAITRARMKLIIIGDVPTLSSAHPFYKKLFEYCQSL